MGRWVDRLMGGAGMRKWTGEEAGGWLKEGVAGWADGG